MESVGPASAADAATPPLRPSPMPRQALEIWTPRLVAAMMLAQLQGLRHARPTLQHAPITVKVDEPR
jgi:hypothetical protein